MQSSEIVTITPYSKWDLVFGLLRHKLYILVSYLNLTDYSQSIQIYDYLLFHSGISKKECFLDGKKRKTLFESQIYHQVWSAYDYSNNKINRTQSACFFIAVLF